MNKHVVRVSSGLLRANLCQHCLYASTPQLWYALETICRDLTNARKGDKCSRRWCQRGNRATRGGAAHRLEVRPPLSRTRNGMSQIFWVQYVRVVCVDVSLTGMFWSIQGSNRQTFRVRRPGRNTTSDLFCCNASREAMHAKSTVMNGLAGCHQLRFTQNVHRCLINRQVLDCHTYSHMSFTSICHKITNLASNASHTCDTSACDPSANKVGLTNTGEGLNFLVNATFAKNCARFVKAISLLFILLRLQNAKLFVSGRISTPRRETTVFRTCLPKIKTVHSENAENYSVLKRLPGDLGFTRKKAFKSRAQIAFGAEVRLRQYLERVYDWFSFDKFAFSKELRAMQQNTWWKHYRATYATVTWSVSNNSQKQ